jgi:hypothetical protein
VTYFMRDLFYVRFLKFVQELLRNVDARNDLKLEMRFERIRISFKPSRFVQIIDKFISRANEKKTHF